MDWPTSASSRGLRDDTARAPEPSRSSRPTLLSPPCPYQVPEHRPRAQQKREVDPGKQPIPRLRARAVLVRSDHECAVIARCAYDRKRKRRGPDRCGGSFCGERLLQQLLALSFRGVHGLLAVETHRYAGMQRLGFDVLLLQRFAR